MLDRLYGAVLCFFSCLGLQMSLVCTLSGPHNRKDLSTFHTGEVELYELQSATEEHSKS